jgi:hypothetical protein
MFLARQERTVVRPRKRVLAFARSPKTWGGGLQLGRGEYIPPERMTDTREMLDASPVSVRLGAAEVAAAIDACLNCLQACVSCANSDVAEEDFEEMRTCIALDQNCADVCDVTARVLSRPVSSDDFVIHRLLQACVRLCTACAEECHKHAHHHRHCAICEKACLACVAACNVLLDAEAFEELQKLAGA